MSIESRLNHLLENATVILIDNTFRILFVSDGHFGIGDKADDSVKNERLTYRKLLDYLDAGYIFFILGDWEELWENDDVEKIILAHHAIWGLIQDYQRRGRVYMIGGNHNMEMGYPQAYVLHNTETDQKVLLIHGHQADFWNFEGWPVARLFVRWIWRGLQMLGAKDPTSARVDVNPKRHEKVRKDLKRWANKVRGRLLMAGHTHFLEIDDQFHDTGSLIGKGFEGIVFEGGTFKMVSFTREGAA